MTSRTSPVCYAATPHPASSQKSVAPTLSSTMSRPRPRHWREGSPDDASGSWARGPAPHHASTEYRHPAMGMSDTTPKPHRCRYWPRSRLSTSCVQQDRSLGTLLERDPERRRRRVRHAVGTCWMARSMWRAARRSISSARARSCRAVRWPPATDSWIVRASWSSSAPEAATSTSDRRTVDRTTPTLSFQPQLELFR